jgi:hypothetical protein
VFTADPFLFGAYSPGARPGLEPGPEPFGRGRAAYSAMVSDKKSSTMLSARESVVRAWSVSDQ